jgi:hypothetical protein
MALNDLVLVANEARFKPRHTGGQFWGRSEDFVPGYSQGKNFHVGGGLRR